MKNKFFILLYIFTSHANAVSMNHETMKIYAECEAAARVVSADWQIKGDYSQTKFWDSYAGKVSSKFLNDLSNTNASMATFWLSENDKYIKALFSQYATMGNSGMRYALSTLQSQDCMSILN